MLTAADLEVNVLDFRQRSFQFERLVEVGGRPFAVFSRTETENERQLRPRLVHLTIVAPQEWVVLDEAADLLRLGTLASLTGEAQVVEVAAEPVEFDEHGRQWRRAPDGPSGFVYVPRDLSGELLGAEGRSALGLRSASP